MRLTVCFLLSIPLLAQVPAPPPPPRVPAQSGAAPGVTTTPAVAPQDLGKLEGVVTNQVTGEPVKKASVTLQSMSGTANAMAMTDASGAFTIRDIPPGQYSVYAQHSSFISQANSFTATSRKPVSIKPGESKKGLQLTVVPAATLSGQVLDGDGEPVPNCQVRLLRMQAQRGRRRLLPVNGVATNANGEFRIGQIAAGKYYVSAQYRGEPVTAHPLEPVRRGPALSSEGYAIQFYPASPDLSGATLVTMSPGSDTRGVDFRLRLVHTVTVHGRLLAPDDANLRQTQISLRPNDPVLGNDTAASFVARRRPDGEFDIPMVTPGSYILSALSFGQAKQYAGSQQIEVGTEPPPDVTLTMYSGVDLAGSVELEDVANAPLQNFHLRLEPVIPLPIGRMPEAMLDGTAFTLPKVMPGRWRVSVDNLGTQGYVKSIRYGDQESRDGVIDVQPGAAAPLRIVVSGKGGTIEGTVQQESDSTLGALVALISEGERAGDSYLYRAMPLFGSGALSFTFTQLPPGKYRLYAAEGSDTSKLLDDADLQKAFESRSESVTVEEGGRIKKQLKAIPLAQLLEKQ